MLIVRLSLSKPITINIIYLIHKQQHTPFQFLNFAVLMRLIILLTFLAIFSFALQAQETDSVATNETRTDSVGMSKMENLDSLKTAKMENLDSSKMAIKEKLAILNSKQDSIGLDSTSLARQAKLDSAQQKLSNKMDSLSSINLTSRLDSAKVLDSLAVKKERIVGKTEETKTEVDAKAGEAKDFTKKLSETTGGPDAGEAIPGMDAALPKGELPGIDGELPNTDIPEVNTDLKDLDADDLKYFDDVDGFGDVSNKLGDVKEIGGEVGQYKNELGEFKKEGVLDKGGEMLENEAGSIEEIGELKSQSGELVLPGSESLPVDNLDVLKDQESVKEEAIKQGKQQVTEHLVGHDEKIKLAMASMSKYKKKYHSLRSARELPNKRPNPLASEPLLHRLVPGFVVEITRNGFTNIDLGPSFGYKIDDRWKVYGSYIYRFYYEGRENTVLNRPSSVYGGRVQGIFTFYKSLFLSGTLEMLRSDVKPESASELVTRDWFNGASIGIGNELDFTQKIKATVQISYNFLHDSDGPFKNAYNIRFGFDFRLRESKKKQQERREKEQGGSIEE